MKIQVLLNKIFILMIMLQINSMSIASEEDAYKILGIKPGASKEEAKKAYQESLKKNHPDLNPNNPDAENQTRKILDAYQTIKRQQASSTNSNHKKQETQRQKESTDKKSHRQNTNSEQSHQRTSKTEEEYRRNHKEHKSGPGYSQHHEEKTHNRKSSYSSSSFGTGPFDAHDFFDNNNRPSWEKFTTQQTKKFDPFL